MFSTWCAGVGSHNQRRLGLGTSTLRRAETSHRRLVGTKHLAIRASYHWNLHVHHFPRCSLLLLVFLSMSCRLAARCFVRG